MIGIIYITRNDINTNYSVGLYHSFIYPYLIYCIESWGNASNCHIDPLSMLLKRILRILTFSNYDVPSELLFRYNNILPLCKLFHYRIGIMMYKYANCILPPPPPWSIVYILLIVMVMNITRGKIISYILIKIPPTNLINASLILVQEYGMHYKKHNGCKCIYIQIQTYV